MSSVDALKLQAKLLRKHFSVHNISLTHSQSLEAVAASLGFRDWNTAAAAASQSPSWHVDAIEQGLAAAENGKLTSLSSVKAAWSGRVASQPLDDDPSLSFGVSLKIKSGQTLEQCISAANHLLQLAPERIELMLPRAASNDFVQGIQVFAVALREQSGISVCITPYPRGVSIAKPQRHQDAASDKHAVFTAASDISGLEGLSPEIGKAILANVNSSVMIAEPVMPASSVDDVLDGDPAV